MRLHQDSPFVMTVDGVRHASPLTWGIIGFALGAFCAWLWVVAH